ncbi:MAG: hypothetical protein AB7N99_07265 [Simkaniaceae bacterium]
MKLRHSQAILLSGFIWMGVGVLLLTKGIQYLAMAGNQVLTHSQEGFSLIQLFSRFSKDSEQAAFIVIALALLLGFFKGRIVMKKAVHRVVERIRSHPSPIPMKKMYSKGYCLLIGSMMGMGFLFKFLPLPLDVKGFIDFTIGIALINGAMLYVRAASLPENP